MIPPLATGLPQLGHHDGAATGMEMTRAFNLAVPSVLMSHGSREGALVPSSGCLLDTGFHDKTKQPINCAGGGGANCGIWDLAFRSQSPLGPNNLEGITLYSHTYAHIP